MKQFTILVDMDDTLVHTVRTWVSWLNAKYNLNVDYDSVVDWDMKLAFPTLTEAQIYEPLACEDFWYLVKPRVDAQVFLKFLMEDGHKIYICSSSHYLTVKYKIHHCLFKHFPYLEHKQLIFIRDKQLLKADFLIDDAIHNLTDGDYQGVMITVPYNKNMDEKALNLVRVNNWEEFYNYIKEKADDEG